MEKQMVNQILETFTHLTGVKTKWIPVKANDYHYNRVEGAVQFILPDKKIEIATETKINIQYAHLPDFLNQQTVNEGLLVLAKYIMPKFKKRMQEMGVNYIDAAGNAFIKLTSLTVIIDGRKEVKTLPDLKAKPFSKTGLKVIFQILVHDDYINATFREIAKAADVSLDTVHKTINGLKELQYLVPLNNYTLKWNNKKELFDRWMTEYETRLKPGLHIGNFTFMQEKDFLTWKKLNFKSATTKWGGEPAGEILTGFLKPERLTIYTKEPKIDWIRNYKLVPSPKGYISIYERFWTFDELRKNTAPPLLVYTDLINTGNRRNMETAQKVYAQYLQDKF